MMPAIYFALSAKRVIVEQAHQRGRGVGRFLHIGGDYYALT